MPRLTPPPSAGGLAFALTRMAWGALLVAVPGRVVVALGGADTVVSRRVERTLGVRHLLQGTVELAAWPRWRRLGVAVDLLHASTGVALAVADRRWRRPAALDASITTAFAAGGVDHQPLDLSSFLLPVLAANDAEIASHERVLGEIDKASNGKTLWRAQQQEAMA